jgi:hypothetical protein
LVRRPGPTEALPGYPDTGVITPGEPYRVSTQAAFWRKETLLALMRDAESIWQFELEGSKRSSVYNTGFYGTWSDILPYRHHVVERGKWFPWEAWRFGRQNIGCDFQARPVMPSSQTAAWCCRKLCSTLLNRIPWRKRLRLVKWAKSIVPAWLVAREH